MDRKDERKKKMGSSISLSWPLSEEIYRFIVKIFFSAWSSENSALPMTNCIP
jgi:hypothetical protein